MRTYSVSYRPVGSSEQFAPLLTFDRTAAVDACEREDRSFFAFCTYSEALQAALHHGLYSLVGNAKLSRDEPVEVLISNFHVGPQLRTELATLTPTVTAITYSVEPCAAGR